LQTLIEGKASQQHSRDLRGAAASDGLRQLASGQFVAADLANPDGAAALADEALRLLGGVDVLVNNAGSQSYVPGGVLAMTEEHWLSDLNINLLASVRLDRALLPSMIAQRGGVIIHITSGQARLPGPASLPYAAAKAALTTYSKGLSNEVAPHGIRVNTVMPGLIESAASNRRVEERARDTGISIEAARQELVDLVGVRAEPGSPTTSPTSSRSSPPVGPRSSRAASTSWTAAPCPSSDRRELSGVIRHMTVPLEVRARRRDQIGLGIEVGARDSSGGSDVRHCDAGPCHHPPTFAFRQGMSADRIAPVAEQGRVVGVVQIDRPFVQREGGGRVPTVWAR
jgi:NAD(P)-dependent dehydrogenase (short-subunit alcohol dehydrogenase family)